MKQVKNEIIILFLVSLTVILILFGLKDSNKEYPVYVNPQDINNQVSSFIGTYELKYEDSTYRLTLRKNGTFALSDKEILVGVFSTNNNTIVLNQMISYEEDGCYSKVQGDNIILSIVDTDTLTIKKDNEELKFIKSETYVEDETSSKYYITTPIDNSSPAGVNKKWTQCRMVIDDKEEEESIQEIIKPDETKKEETKPETTTEESKTTTPVKETIVYGDTTLDGKVNVLDANLLNRYLKEGYELDSKAKKNADINADGKLDNTDYVLIRAVCAKVYNHNTSTPLKTYTIYGDVNNNSAINVIDANLINKYLNEGYKLDAQGLKNADVNADGKIDNTDYILLRAISAKIYNHIGDTPLKTYTIYGDLNLDGKINIVDANLLNRHLNESYRLEAQAYKNADINGDNKVDPTDYLLIRAVSANIYPHLGDSPLKNYTIYGDVNSDCKINVVDANLVNRYLNAGYELDAQAYKNADINGDGKIDATDQQLIKDVAAKKYDHNGISPLKVN